MEFNSKNFTVSFALERIIGLLFVIYFITLTVNVVYVTGVPRHHHNKDESAVSEDTVVSNEKNIFY